jgi:hypothetical protein
MSLPHAGKESASVDKELECLERYSAETLPQLHVEVAV